MTSRMEGASVRSMTQRSIPIPSPAVGGIPNSRARRKSSSRRENGIGLIASLFQLLDKAFPLIDGVVQFRETIGDLPAGDEELKSVHHLRILPVPTREGRDLCGIMSDKSRLKEMRLDHLFKEIGQNPSMGGSLFQFEAEASWPLRSLWMALSGQPDQPFHIPKEIL